MRTALLDRPTRARRVGSITIPAPVEGWDCSQALADMGPKRAIRLDNMFPRSEHVEIRKGYIDHARLANEMAPIESLLPYHGTLSSRLFAASGVSLYDVTDAGLINEPVLTDLGDARFEHVNFSGAIGSVLWVCNGIIGPQYYDGTTWTVADITGVPAAAICDVEVYKGRLWVALEDSTQVGYFIVDAVQGAVTPFELGTVMSRGGVIQAIATWSIDGGDGPDDQLVFITSRGQVIVFTGLDPEDPQGWSLVGVYDIGTPVGRRCVTKIGADLAIICVDGVYPLSQVMGLSRATQGTRSVTRRINPAIASSARSYGANFGWELTAYPRGPSLILNVPIVQGELAHQYVMNTETGAWCRFTGQNANCWAVFQDRLFFGGRGRVLEADVAGSDMDGPLVIDLKTAFRSNGRSMKARYTMAQVMLNADEGINISLGVDTDYQDGREIRPLPSSPQEVSRWGQFVWGRDTWAQPVTQTQNWVPIEGIGQTVAVRLRAEVGIGTSQSIWGTFVWGEDVWSMPYQAEALFQVNGFNITAEQGGYL